MTVSTLNWLLICDHMIIIKQTIKFILNPKCSRYLSSENTCDSERGLISLIYKLPFHYMYVLKFEYKLIVA